MTDMDFCVFDLHVRVDDGIWLLTGEERGSTPAPHLLLSTCHTDYSDGISSDWLHSHHRFALYVIDIGMHSSDAAGGGGVLWGELSLSGAANVATANLTNVNA